MDTRLRTSVINQLADDAMAEISEHDLRLDGEDAFAPERPSPWEERAWPGTPEARKQYRHLWVLTRHRVLLAAATCLATEYEQAVALDIVRARVLRWSEAHWGRRKESA